MTSPLFRFSLLSLALAAGFAHAENEAKESCQPKFSKFEGSKINVVTATNVSKK